MKEAKYIVLDMSDNDEYYKDFVSGISANNQTFLQ